MNQSLICMTFICLLLFPSFASAVFIRNLHTYFTSICVHFHLSWLRDVHGNPYPRTPVRFYYEPEFVDPAKFSWDFLPASDGNHYICIKNTNLCLTSDYNKETQRVDVLIQEKNKNPETYWIEKLQQWK